MYLTPFIFGALSASFALILELIILNIGPVVDYTASPITFSGIALLLAVAIIEELSKFIFLHRYLLSLQKSISLSRLRSTLALGLPFGAGFAALEIAFAITDRTLPFAFLPLLGIFLVHTTTSLAITTALTHQNSTRRLLGLALFVAVGIHFLYNMALSFIP